MPASAVYLSSMDQLRTLKYANLALGALAMLGVLFGLVFVLAGIFGEVEGPAGGTIAFIVNGLLVMGVFGALAFAHVYVGFMVTAGRSRSLQTTLATLHIANFPLGTLYAGYALWVCWMNPSTTSIFDRPAGRRVR